MSCQKFLVFFRIGFQITEQLEQGLARVVLDQGGQRPRKNPLVNYPDASQQMRCHGLNPILR